MSDQVEIPKGARILVSRTDRIGDLLLALPLAESIKLRHPDCEVYVMASLYASPVVEHNPNIDGIVRVQLDQLISNGRYRVELRPRWRNGISYGSIVSRAACRCLATPGEYLTGSTYDFIHSFQSSYSPQSKTNRKHELEYNLDFLRFLPTAQWLRLRVSSD